MITGAELAEPVVVPSLARWGLSPDADLVYRALHSLGAQPAGLLHSSLGLTMARALSACDELHAAGLARPVSNGWHVLAPDQAVTRLRRSRTRARPGVPAPAGHTEALVMAGIDPAAGQAGMEELRGLDAVRDRIGELAAAERFEHLAMNPEAVAEAATVAVAAPLDLALLARNVRLRTISRPPADGDATANHADKLGKLGAEQRTTVHVPAKLLIYDRRVALMPIDPADLTRGAVQVNAPIVVDALVALFARCWASATDPRTAGVSDVELTERERALIVLLGRGHTDDTAARQLGVSPRTVSSTLRGLMDRIGVDSRFALGLALGRSGARVPPL
ncbi:helix-turn-helix transcriptional regulator [Longispora albida]|uniref:helix-turn-helix transcriptional regulator n=1 Tax=Longispora albida TaxID=203523 RepID=UPI0003623DA0|nr:helix-turn-helix transcriptional regulator [Longispora albida]